MSVFAGTPYDMRDRVAVITGGAGLLGREHAAALLALGAAVVLIDINDDTLETACRNLSASQTGATVVAAKADIRDRDAIASLCRQLLERFGRIDALINNAAIDSKVSGTSGLSNSTRFEHFPLANWDQEIAVGLTGSFLCCQVFGSEMASRGIGVILNIASDLAVISPDQRLYEVDGLSAAEQPVKPVTYSVIKTALLGLTRYLATYWAQAGVRVNAISPGGVFNGQPDAFVARLTSRIPMNRMARADEYRAAVQFLCSDASSYMTGQNLVVDGGRTVW